MSEQPQLEDDRDYKVTNSTDSILDLGSKLLHANDHVVVFYVDVHIGNKTVRVALAATHLEIDHEKQVVNCAAINDEVLTTGDRLKMTIYKPGYWTVRLQ